MLKVFKMKRFAVTLFIIIQIAIPHVSSAQWVPMDGPYGGRITGLVSDSTGTLYALAGFNLMKTSDITAGWDIIRTSTDNHNHILMTFDNVLLVATDSGAVRSFDGGITWEDASNGLQGKITSMKQLPGGRIVSITQLNDNEFYTCITDNTGSDWNAVPHDGGSFSSLETDPVTGYAYFISGFNAGEYSLYRSADGIDWQVSDLPNSFYYLQDFMVDAQGRIYVICSNNDQLAFYIKRSSDQGETWTIIAYLGGPDFYYSISQIDNGDLIITSSSMTFLRSVDDGANWQIKSTGVFNMGLRAIFEVPGYMVFGQSNNGLFYSPDNGYNWLWASNGITPNDISAVAVSDSGVIIASTERSRLWKSHDDGITWLDITAEVPSFNSCEDILFSGNHFWIYYSEYFQYQFARSVGNGQWDVMDTPVWPVCLNANENGEVYIGSGMGLYKSEDFGDTWNELTGTVLPDLLIHDVMCLNIDTTICLGSSGGNNLIYLSGDSGNTWQLVYEPDFGINNKFHKDGMGNIYLGISESIYDGYPAYYYTSNDNGSTWSSIDFPDSLQVEALYTDAADGLYVISDNTIFKSTDTGLSWSIDMEGLPADGFFYWLTESENSNIYLTRNRSELYRKAVLVSAEESPLPSEAAFTIYPNPASNTLVIDYPGLNRGTTVVLQLYDISGKCLREYKISSEKTTIDLTGIVPGIYLIKGEGDASKVVKLKSSSE